MSQDMGAFSFEEYNCFIMRVVADNLPTFETEVKNFVTALTPDPARATLVTLSGELGAGKTAFTKVVAKTFGVEEIVNSPTFVLEKIYRLPENKPFKRLIHIDAYRLEKGSELAPLGFDESMKDAGNLILLEWPEKVSDALPNPAYTVSITTSPEGVRTISYG